jgi:hypothetical protein
MSRLQSEGLNELESVLDSFWSHAILGVVRCRDWQSARESAWTRFDDDIAFSGEHFVLVGPGRSALNSNWQHDWPNYPDRFGHQHRLLVRICSRSE